MCYDPVQFATGFIRNFEQMILEQVVVLFPIVDLIDGVMVHWILKPEGQ